MSLGQFTAALDAHAALLHDRMDELVQNVAFTVAENVVVGGEYATGTPVDTGFARASWHVGLGALPAAWQPTGGKQALQAQAGAKMAELGLTLLEVRAGVPVFLVSHCVYMEALEHGHSLQAPYGMVELTLAAAQLIVNDVAKAMQA